MIRFGLADDSYPWIRHGVPGSQWPVDAVDFHTLVTVARQTPGEDGLVMRLAAGLGLGGEISPAVLGQVDDDRRALPPRRYRTGARGGVAARPRDCCNRFPQAALDDVTAGERRGLDRLLRDPRDDGEDRL